MSHINNIYKTVSQTVNNKHFTTDNKAIKNNDIKNFLFKNHISI